MSTRRNTPEVATSSGTYRTGLSLPKPLYQDAAAIAKAAHHRSFSGYIEYLIRRDREQRQSPVTVA